MKHLSTVCLGMILLLQTAALSAQETTTGSNTKVQATSNAGGMQGAYSMLMQIANDGTKDSIMNVQQFKIYTDRHFMYAHALPGDSLAEFGIGTYRMDNPGSLIEYPFYTAARGAHNDTIGITITKLGNGYVQVIDFGPDSTGRSTVLTEEYGNVSTPVTSPLDGAWKQTKAQFIPKSGSGSTAMNNTSPTQFKIYQSGHFMWASTFTDSATQRSGSAFGYGTFVMNGKNKMSERTTNSTYRATLIGKPVTVQLKFTGADAYQQTIDWPDGRSIEEYQRMK